MHNFIKDFKSISSQFEPIHTRFQERRGKGKDEKKDLKSHKDV